jgi:transposase
MLQPHVFFEDNSNNRNSAKRGSIERAELANKQLGEARSIADKEYKEINIENAPNEISLCNNQTTKEVPMERCSYSTYVIGKGKEYSFEFKQDAVFAAQELGLKPAARKFKVSRNTLRAWSRRFDEKGKKGLYDRRQGPNYIPNKMPKEMEERIVNIRKMTKCFGPKRIKYHYQIPYSLGAIQRVIKSNGLTRKLRKVREKRRDMRAVKAKRASMTHLQMDVKYLTDIPNYWEQLKPLGLPKYQYTVRETKTGMLFLGYSDELSELNARTMIDYVLDEMKWDLPFDISDLTVQTDNGSEFSGQARRIENAPFVQMIEKTHGANHVYIRPGHCNAQADVESSHQLIETEFFDLTRFVDRDDFFRKAESYRLYFNFVRPNFYKEGKTPQQICASDWGSNTSYNLSLIKTVDLDRMSTFSYQRGQSIPGLTDLTISID